MGTTPAAGVKAKFLKDIVTGAETVAEISPEFALEQLSHMKGGPSVEALLDIALSDDANNAAAGEVLKSQVFLYDADTKRLADDKQCPEDKKKPRSNNTKTQKKLS